MAGAFGMDPAALAARVGLPGDVFQNPDLRVPLRDVALLLELAVQESQAEDFVLRMARGRRLSTWGPLGLLMEEQGSAYESLAAGAPYAWTHTDFARFDLIESGHQAMLTLALPHAPDDGAFAIRHLYELGMSTLCLAMRGMVGERWAPEAVMFIHPSSGDLERYVEPLGVVPRFGQEFCGVLFRRDELDAPRATYDPERARLVRKHMIEVMGLPAAPFSLDVQAIIERSLIEGACSPERVAAELGLNLRTLQRRLAAEAVTYVEVLNAARKSLMATHAPSRPRNLSETARLLGFSSISSFSRWYRAHHGVSLTQHRRDLAGAR